MNRITYLIAILLIITVNGCKKTENPLTSEIGPGKWEIIASEKMYTFEAKIYFYDKQNGWIIGDSGYVSSTNNGGLSWTRQQSGIKKTLYSIYFTDSKNGFIGGADKYLLRTTDGGLNWQKTAFNNDTTNFVTFITSQGGKLWLGSGKKIYNSNDNGKSWQYKFSISNTSADDFFTFGSTFFTGRWISRTIGKSTDGGQSWTEIKPPFLFLNNIYFFNEKTGWATEDNAPSSINNDTSSVFMTTDGGESWKKAFSVEAIETNNINFTDENNGWFTCWSYQVQNRISRQRIYNTTDGGKTFNIQYSAQSDQIITDMFFLDKYNGWALTIHGQVIRFSR